MYRQGNRGRSFGRPSGTPKKSSPRKPTIPPRQASSIIPLELWSRIIAEATNVPNAIFEGPLDIFDAVHIPAHEEIITSTKIKLSLSLVCRDFRGLTLRPLHEIIPLSTLRQVHRLRKLLEASETLADRIGKWTKRVNVCITGIDRPLPQSWAMTNIRGAMLVDQKKHFKADLRIILGHCKSLVHQSFDFEFYMDAYRHDDIIAEHGESKRVFEDWAEDAQEDKASVPFIPYPSSLRSLQCTYYGGCPPDLSSLHTVIGTSNELSEILGETNLPLLKSVIIQDVGRFSFGLGSFLERAGKHLTSLTIHPPLGSAMIARLVNEFCPEIDSLAVDICTFRGYSDRVKANPVPVAEIPAILRCSSIGLLHTQRNRLTPNAEEWNYIFGYIRQCAVTAEGRSNLKVVRLMSAAMKGDLVSKYSEVVARWAECFTEVGVRLEDDKGALLLVP